MRIIMLRVNKKIVGGVVTQGVDYMTVDLWFFYLFIDLYIGYNVNHVHS